MFLQTVIAGIGATALMTSFVYALDFVIPKPLKVVKILGTMLTGQTTPNQGLSNKPSAIIAGIIGHYMIGIIFAFAWLGLMYIGIFSINYLHGILFGALAGIVGVIIWKIYFTMHPNPPAIQLNVYFLTIFLGHIIFGIGLIGMYLIMN